MSATQYAIEVFKRTNRSDTVGQWERADALRDAVAEEMPDQGRAMARASNGVNDGTYQAVEKVAVKLMKGGIPEDLAITTVADYRSTSLAWPEEDRLDPLKASYDVHAELSGRKWDGRRRHALERLVERSSRGYTTRADVRRWKSEQDPPKSTSWERRFEGKFAWLFERWVDRPQAPGEWQTAVRLLRMQLAEAERRAAEDA